MAIQLPGNDRKRPSLSDSSFSPTERDAIVEMQGGEDDQYPPPNLDGPGIERPVQLAQAGGAGLSDAPTAMAQAPAETAAPKVNAPPRPQLNPFDQFDADEDSGQAGLLERARLNAVDGYYRGDPVGAGELRNLAMLADFDEKSPGFDKSPGFGAPSPKELKERYQQVIGDLARYDLLSPWGSTTEAAAALGGQLYGNLTPAMLLRIPLGVKWAATAGGRIAEGATQGALTNWALDPATQSLAIEGGGLKEYDWTRTALAGPVGAVVGGGLVGAGQVLSPANIRRWRAEAGKEDPSLRAAGDEAPAPEAVPPAAEAKVAEATPEAAPPRAADVTTPTPEPGKDTGIPPADVTTPPDVVAPSPKGPQARDESTFSLFEFLASRGGIKPDGDLAHILDGNPFIPGFGRLIRKDGMSLDRAREAAVEAGYLRDAPAQEAAAAGTAQSRPTESTINHLLDAIGGEARGERRYREGREDTVTAGEASREAERRRFDIEREIDHIITEGGAKVDDKVRARAIQIIEKEGVSDPAVAFERAVMENAERYENIAKARREEIGDIPGWDAALRGTAPEAGGAVRAARSELEPRGAGEGTGTGGPARGAGEAGRGAGDDLALARRQSGGTLAKEQQRAPAGVPQQQVAQTAQAGTAVAKVAQPPSPEQGAALRSLQQQAFDFADAIGFPLRQGRVTVRDALGIYKTKSGVVRVKEVPDFEVVAHEGGHAIEGKAGKPLTALTKQFIHELGPLDYDPAKARANEGFAEYIRRYIGNPAHAQQVAPTFSKAFEAFMQKDHPDMWVALQNASNAYRAYLNAPSVDAVGAVRRSVDEQPQGWRYLLSEMKALGFSGTINAALAHSYTAMADVNAPVARAVREMVVSIKEKSGTLVELKAADNPETLIRLFGRWEQAGVLDMMKGVRPYHGVTPEGPSLSAALAKATGQPSILGKWDTELRTEFSKYLIARRAAVLWDKFERGDLPNPPVAFSKADAVVALADLERANPQFREASQMVHDYSRQLLRKSFDGNLIGAELYDKLLKEEFYVPFYRDMSDRPLAEGDPARRGAADRVADVVQRMKGSSRDIKDPIESLMIQTFLVNRTVKHNDIMLALEGLAKRAGNEGGRYFEKLPAHEAKRYTFDLADAIERAGNERGVPPDDMKVVMGAVTDVFGKDPLIGSFFRMEPAGKRGEPIVFYKRGGELQVGRIMSAEEGHALYETLTQLPTALSDVGLKLLSVSSSTLRLGVTSNPVYALTNYIRDQVAAGILRSDYVPFVSGWKGLMSEVRGGEAAQLYGYAGGVSAGASIAPIKQAADAQVSALAKQGYLVNRFSSLHGILELTSITEAGTRNSIFDTVFKDKKKQGLSDYEAMIEAAYAAQDIMDFSRWGSKTMAIRALTPFVNAHIQGLDKARRTLFEPLFREAVTTTDAEAKRNAVASLTKLFAVGSALGAGWAALHHSDEIYQDAKAEMKGTHFVTSIGGKILVVPKPFELSLGFTAGEFAYQRLMKDDPRAAAQFAEAAYEVLKPPVPIFANPLIKTPAELVSNYSFFTGRPIVPDKLKRLDTAQQYTDRTSALAKSLGGAIGVSPIKVDYGIGAMFGLWGRDIAALSSGVDDAAPSQQWEDRVFFRRFLKDPTRSSEVTGKFWDFMARDTGKYNQAVASYDALVKGFRDSEAADFLARLKPAERAFVTLKSAANEEGRPAFSPDERRLHPLQRAYDAVLMLNGLRGEMSDNSFKTFESGQNVKLSPTDRRDLLDGIRELAQKEMRNALAITKTEGWGGRQVLDLAPTMARIEKISPEVAAEIKTRYATSKIYTTDAVAKSYETMQRNVLRDGGEAELGDLVSDAEGAGYEFGAERVKKPQKRRVPIKAKLP